MSSSTPLRFDNRFVNELAGDPETGARRRQVEAAAWSSIAPTPVATPRLLAYSREMAETLGLDPVAMGAQAFAEVFAGNRLLPGMQPYAANYGGHQFGNWAGQLGDGRAISLGELVTGQGQRWELQLKGAGPTPYSRTADGRAVLRSSIREFLCSEAMHHLGIPTTRALSLVASGEQVLRDMFYDGHPKPEPGAIVCRVAPSFLRFGNFELPASRNDVALLRQLVEFCIRRDYPQLQGQGEALYAQWFEQICIRTAQMIAGWMRVGFVHGVMNTDNMSVLGLTIDYGPYGWIDDFDPEWTPNTTDAGGRRYRFGWQSRVAYWNLTRLGQALSLLFADVASLQQGLDAYVNAWDAAERDNVARKLGIRVAGPQDMAAMQRLQELLQAGEVDMSLFFRALMQVQAEESPDLMHELELFEPAFYDLHKRDAIATDLQQWLQAYRQRLREDALEPTQRGELMRLANPKYVLRNYLAQQVIDRAEQGDASGIDELLEVMRHPYDEQPGREAFAQRRPDWARDKAGCSMLSCSS